MAKTQNAPATAPQANDDSTGEAERQHSKTQEHVWDIKGTGTEIHKKYDGVKLRQTLAGYGETPEEAMDNMLALCDNHYAVTDLFNQAFRLAAQKHTKDAPMGTRQIKETVDGKEITRTVEPTATVDELQSRILGFRGSEIRRKGTSDTARRKEEKAKASLLDQLAAETDPQKALEMLRQIQARQSA